MSAIEPTELPTETPTLAKRAKWRRLETISDVRQALAAIIKRVYDGALPPERGGTCITGLRVLHQVLHDSQLEERMRALEDRLHDRTQ